MDSASTAANRKQNDGGNVSTVTKWRSRTELNLFSRRDAKTQRKTQEPQINTENHRFLIK